MKTEERPYLSFSPFFLYLYTLCVVRMISAVRAHSLSLSLSLSLFSFSFRISFLSPMVLSAYFPFFLSLGVGWRRRARVRDTVGAYPQSAENEEKSRGD
jgi:hypothetical protein